MKESERKSIVNWHMVNMEPGLNRFRPTDTIRAIVRARKKHGMMNSSYLMHKTRKFVGDRVTVEGKKKLGLMAEKIKTMGLGPAKDAAVLDMDNYRRSVRLRRTHIGEYLLDDKDGVLARVATAKQCKTDQNDKALGYGVASNMMHGTRFTRIYTMANLADIGASERFVPMKVIRRLDPELVGTLKERAAKRKAKLNLVHHGIHRQGPEGPGEPRTNH